jgi:uncharacterized protein YqgV (UPF0045/DUF77 family)
MKSALAIQCLPQVSGGKEAVHQMVDKAIEAIEASGLPFTVGPFETVVEGPLDDLFEVAKQAHLAILAAGSDGVSTYMKLFTSSNLGTSEEKTAKYRARGH